MNHAMHRISLDIHDSASQVQLTTKKGDTSRTICATLMENGRPYALTEECSAVFTAKKPDGNILYNACVILGNVIRYEVTPQTTATAGTVSCELRVYGGDGEQITSPRFTIVVEPTVYNDGDVIESTSEASALVDDSKACNKLWSSKNTVDKLCSAFTESGAVVTCNPVEGYPLSIVSHIEAVQSGTGDPSPDNIRPISGWDDVNLTVCGKNLATNFTNRVQNGEFVGRADTLHQDELFFANLEQGKTYTVSCNQVNDLTSKPPRNTLMVRYPDGTTKYETDFEKQYKGLHSITFTANTTGKYTFMYWEHTFSNDVTFNNFQLEAGSAATPYEPYRGKTFTMDLGQTAYSGSLNWNRGELLVDGTLLNINPNEISFDASTGLAYTTVASQNGLPMDTTHRGLCNRLSSINAGGGEIFSWGGPGTNEIESLYSVIYKVSDEVFTPERIPELYDAIVTYQPASTWEQDESGEYIEIWPPMEEHIITADNLTHIEPGNVDPRFGDISGGHMYFGVGSDEMYFVYDDTLPIGPYGELSKGIWVSSGSGAYIANLKYGANMGYSLQDGGVIQFRLPDVTSETEARTWVTENPLQVYYKLVEPINVQLTPQEILALAGTNTIYSSTGNTDVSGKADPNVIIQDLYNKLNTLSATVAALTGV